uniref:Uncharacterized protein n=1 Tax=Hyaloperonospora arabidopsidis (strain Emoy2) TaxID=559515 RepID=M4B7V4_HYAAE
MKQKASEKDWLDEEKMSNMAFFIALVRMHHNDCMKVIEKPLNWSASVKLEVSEKCLLVINVLHYQWTIFILLL